LVQEGAGLAASFSDQEYIDKGAVIVRDAAELYGKVDVVLKVQAPLPQEGQLIREGAVYMGFLSPLLNADAIRTFVERRITSFSMEYIPRITRAQSMDALSSMATVAGYKAVLMAADRLPKMFPLLMTAAGTVPPATVFVLGAGVAGLQAIATAKRLGAKVEAFDPRPAVKEQVQSLGASFVEMEMPEDIETEGGYAKEATEEFIKKEMEAISARLPKVDVVITTAQIFGKRAPLLITADMVKLLRPGSVIVDLAAEQGGNCELTEAGKIIEKDGITIMGAVNLPATIPVHASQMYGKNLIDLFLLLFPKEATSPNLEEEIAQGCCITHNGEIVNDRVKSMMENGGKTQ
jgi:NAD(P) transhydrogenase subunit alpha